MRESFPLSELMPGEKASVVSVAADSALYRRLLDIGFTKGAVIECVGRSPAGDPSAYLVRGAVIALRCADVRNIFVQCL